MLYPIGIQTFEKIRAGGFAYVDKTEYVYRLATSGNCYFLSRPRRFGKSLLISTMESYFSGRRDLFEGLAIEKLEKNWTQYEVLHFDMSEGKVVKCADDLYRTLNKALSGYEKIYGTDPAETNVELRFKGIIERAYEKSGHGVVILIDEYDKPMLDSIDSPEALENIRDFLKGFYGNLKSQDKYIKFSFLTGITKFSHLSIFSGLNNLNDISMDLEYSGICGITKREISECFGESVREFAESNDMSEEQALEKLERQYDGYHFHQKGDGVYNPFSLLNALNKGEIRNYWFATGTPTYLVRLLQRNDYDVEQLENVEQTQQQLEGVDSVDSNCVPLLYQSGYLTICGYDREFRKYILGYPNKEVEEGFVDFLAPYYFSSKSGRDMTFFVQNFVKDVRSGNADQFMQRLQSLFDDTTYEMARDKEVYFQSSLYFIFRMTGFYTEVERASSRGRADVIIKTPGYIYILELKLDGSADEALQQIEEKGYAEPYAQDSRKVFKIGVNFSSETRSITDWKFGK